MLATKRVDLHVRKTSWQVPVAVRVPNPEMDMMYAIKVHSADGNPVMVDAYRFTASW